MLRIRDIDDKKKADLAHAEEKKKRLAMYFPEPEKDPNEEELLKQAQATMNTTMKSTKKKKMVEIDPEELERQRKEAEYQ
jgi:hypothetical protein